MSEYLIIGDTAKFKDCLVTLCGNSKLEADITLDRMINNPNENDVKLTNGISNLRIEEVDVNKMWWNN